jgi:hypothetical protein
MTIYSPTASNHDASQDGTGVVTLTGPITLTAGTHWGGMFLAAVAVATADTIDAATLNYKPTGVNDSPDFRAYGENVDNAAVFTTAASSISGRPRTTNYATSVGTDVGTAVWQQVNIKPVLDEIKARAGWVSGNNMALILDSQSSSQLVIATFDSGTNVWFVEITVTPAGGGGITRKMVYYARARG